MKRRFTEEQIIGMLREQEAGGTVKEVIRTQIALCPVRWPSWRLALVHMAPHKSQMVAPISAMYGIAPTPAHPPVRAIFFWAIFRQVERPYARR